jgi:hypothetical protein
VGAFDFASAQIPAVHRSRAKNFRSAENAEKVAIRMGRCCLFSIICAGF